MKSVINCFTSSSHYNAYRGMAGGWLVFEKATKKLKGSYTKLPVWFF